MSTTTMSTTKLDIYRSYATHKQFQEARPRGSELFKSVAHDVAQHRQYRKKRGNPTTDAGAYIHVREAALKAAAAAAEAAPPAAAAAEADTRDAQLAAKTERLQQLQAELQSMTRRRDIVQHDLDLAREQISELTAENVRLTELLYQHGYERPYKRPSSQALIDTYFAASSGAKRKRKRRRQR